MLLLSNLLVDIKYTIDILINMKINDGIANGPN